MIRAREESTANALTRFPAHPAGATLWGRGNDGKSLRLGASDNAALSDTPKVTPFAKGVYSIF
jgi:hypothetical protein